MGMPTPIADSTIKANTPRTALRMMVVSLLFDSAGDGIGSVGLEVIFSTKIVQFIVCLYLNHTVYS